MDFAVVTQSLEGVVPFLIYVGLSLGMIGVYFAIYSLVTAHDELPLIRANNVSATLAFAGSLVGYSLPLGSAALHSRAIGEFLLWAAIAIVVQIVVYFFFRLLMLPDMSRRIDRGELSAGILLGAASLAGGVVNAAAMAV